MIFQISGPSKKFSELFLFLIIFIYFSPCNDVFASPEDDSRVKNREGVILAQRGEIQNSLLAFEAACRVNPFDENALSNLACAHNNLGVILVKEHRFDEAIEHFENARSIKPEDLQIRFNLLSALVTIKDYENVVKEAKLIEILRPKESDTLLKIAGIFQKIEDQETAQNLLEKILEMDPQNEKALFMLANLYYQEGNFFEARFNVERLLKLFPQNIPANEFYKKILREESLEGSFERETSGHFSITFRDGFSPDQVKEILEIFENAYLKLGDFLDYYPSQKVQVIAYFDGDLLKSRDLPKWAGGVYDGKIRLPIPKGVFNAGLFEGAIFHEYCHHLVFLITGGNCPTWLNEGLAQIMEKTSPQIAREILFSRDLPNLFPLSKLEGPFALQRSRHLAEKFYAQSLITVSLILENHGMTAIQKLLSNLGKKFSINEAISQELGYSVETLEEKVRQNLIQ